MYLPNKEGRQTGHGLCQLPLAVELAALRHAWFGRQALCGPNEPRGSGGGMSLSFTEPVGSRQPLTPSMSRIGGTFQIRKV
jgi:hypothetical protein